MIAFGHKFTSADKTMITAMAKLISDSSLVFCDLGSYEVPAISNKDIVLIFGEKAGKILDIHPGKKLKLPQPALLHRALKNETMRVAAHQAILNFKRELENNTAPAQKAPQKLTPEDLPELPADSLTALESNLKAQGIKEWYGVTSNGKSIRLTPLPQPNGGADINMTFSELYAMKNAFGLFGLKEIQVNCFTK